jgi:hypothetical protein
VLGVESHFGISISRALNIALGLNMPVFISIGAGTATPPSTVYRYNAHLVWPILAGGGLEYFIRSDVMLFARFHVGPMINIGNFGGAGVGIDLKAGIGWKF